MMKKLLITLALLSASAVASAKQHVACYRYAYFSVGIADRATADLDKLISQGYKIVSFSLNFDVKYMIVIYDDMR